MPLFAYRTKAKTSWESFVKTFKSKPEDIRVSINRVDWFKLKEKQQTKINEAAENEALAVEALRPVSRVAGQLGEILKKVYAITRGVEPTGTEEE